MAEGTLPLRREDNMLCRLCSAIMSRELRSMTHAAPVYIHQHWSLCQL